MEELRYNLGSLIKIGSISDSSAILASLLPPLELTRADAASSRADCCEGFSLETSFISGGECIAEVKGILTLCFSERRIDLIVCEVQ